MYIPNFQVTEGKIALIIYDLASGEGEVKYRLIKVLEERCAFSKVDFPVELQKEWENIHKMITSTPGDEYRSAYKNSLLYRRNKTCSKIVKRITCLYCALKNYNRL